MTYKQIETSREIRLWIGQIIVPTVTVVATMMTVPEVRHSVVKTVNNVGKSIKNKFNKENKKRKFKVIKG